MEARLEGGSMDRRKEQEHATAPGDADDVEMSADLMALARKMRMSTDVRKAVFCAVMGAEDYVDAGHRLAKLMKSWDKDSENYQGDEITVRRGRADT